MSPGPLEEGPACLGDEAMYCHSYFGVPDQVFLIQWYWYSHPTV